MDLVEYMFGAGVVVILLMFVTNFLSNTKGKDSYRHTVTFEGTGSGVEHAARETNQFYKR